jgi:hypothetical protein
LVSFNGSQFKTIGSLPNNFEQFCEFDRNNETRILASNMNSLYVINRDDFTLIHSIPFYNEIINIDYANNEILSTRTSDSLTVYSLIDGSWIGSVPFNMGSMSGSLDYQNFFLMNHCVFSRKGVAYFINSKK